MKRQKLINFKKDEDFQKDLEAGELLETSIIFVDDTKKIYTHGTEFDCSGDCAFEKSDTNIKVKGRTATFKSSAKDCVVLGNNATVGGEYSVAEGNNCEATGGYSHAEGSKTKATGARSHSEGTQSEATGDYSHAEGSITKAIGESSHSEGYYSVANGARSHAEGRSSTWGQYSHSEGHYSEALGKYSHAEGDYTVAIGESSHAAGVHTQAINKAEVAVGYWNKIGFPWDANHDFGWFEDSTLFTVGNGTSEYERHNAFEVRQNGDVYIADTNAEGNAYEKPMIKLQDALNNSGSSNDDSIVPYPNANQIVYTTTDGEVCVLWDSTTVKENVYYKSKGYGIVTFNNDLTIVPRFSGYKSDDGKRYGTNIKTVVLPDNVTGFADYCFNYDAKYLESVNIPEGVTEISNYCFYGTKSLFNLYLPSTVVKIGNYAFNSSNISNIDLSKVKSIGSSAFYECKNLLNIDLGMCETLGTEAFKECTNLLNIAFGNKLTEIPNNCFSGCSSLTKINLQGIQNIVMNAFYNCNNIEEIIINTQMNDIQIAYNAYSFANVRYFYFRGTGIVSNLIPYASNMKLETVILADIYEVGEIDNLSYFPSYCKIYVPSNLVQGFKNKYPNRSYMFHPLEGEDTYVYKDNFWTGTQDEYDAITSKDSNTFYFIKEG